MKKAVLLLPLLFQSNNMTLLTLSLYKGILNITWQNGDSRCFRSQEIPEILLKCHDNKMDDNVIWIQQLMDEEMFCLFKTHESECNLTTRELPVLTIQEQLVLTTKDSQVLTTPDMPVLTDDHSPTIAPCPCDDKITPIALGSMLGLLVVLLALVTTGWVWTCWIMMKQNIKINSLTSTRFGTMQASSNVHSYHNQPHTVQHVNDSEPSVSQNVDSTYEVIPPLPYEPIRLNEQQVMSERADNLHVHERQITTAGQQVSQGYLTGETDSQLNRDDQQTGAASDQHVTHADADRNVYHILEPQFKEDAAGVRHQTM